MCCLFLLFSTTLSRETVWNEVADSSAYRASIINGYWRDGSRDDTAPYSTALRKYTDSPPLRSALSAPTLLSGKPTHTHTLLLELTWGKRVSHHSLKTSPSSNVCGYIFNWIIRVYSSAPAPSSLTDFTTLLQSHMHMHKHSEIYFFVPFGFYRRYNPCAPAPPSRFLAQPASLFCPLFFVYIFFFCFPKPPDG